MDGGSPKIACGRRYRIQAPVQMLEYYHAKDMIVMITNTMILKTFSFEGANFEVEKTNGHWLHGWGGVDAMEGSWGTQIVFVFARYQSS